MRGVWEAAPYTIPFTYILIHLQNATGRVNKRQKTARLLPPFNRSIVLSFNIYINRLIWEANTNMVGATRTILSHLSSIPP